MILTGFGNLRTANWRTGNLRTNSANYGREPRVQCEPESENFFYAIKSGPYTCLGITQYRNDFHNDSKRRKKPTQCQGWKKPRFFGIFFRFLGFFKVFEVFFRF